MKKPAFFTANVSLGGFCEWHRSRSDHKTYILTLDVHHLLSETNLWPFLVSCKGKKSARLD